MRRHRFSARRALPTIRVMSERAAPPHERFGNLTYDVYRQLAGRKDLSAHERIGFPDDYREGAETAIYADIRTKLPAIDDPAGGRVIVDVGAGCAGLPRLLRTDCERHGHELVLVDSPEMLAHHDDGPGVRKVAGRFPACEAQLADVRERADAVLVYSVLQCALTDVSPFDFVDAALELLAPGGRLLLGDLPNAAMRKRFLASEAGRAHHRVYTGEDADPDVTFNRLDRGQLDDGLALGLLSRARSAGFHAWIVPQAAGLPMANRREDVLIERP